MKLILSSFLCLSLFSCYQESPLKSAENKTKPQLKEKKSLFDMKGELAGPVASEALLFDSQLTNYYSHNAGKTFPAIPMLIDDPQSRQLFVVPPLLCAQFGSSYFDQLPSNLQAAIKNHIDDIKNNVDIAFIVQSNALLGEKEDHEDRWTTRISLHAWTEPHGPAHFDGVLVNRKFLLGVFDSNSDISTHDFPMNTIEHSVHVFLHDGLFSPRTPKNMIEYKGDFGLSEPLAFWSLAIDNNPPANKSKRAIATLHWILDSSHAQHHYPNYQRPLSDATFLGAHLITKAYFSKDLGTLVKPKLLVKNFHEFLIAARKMPFLKNSSALRKLEFLFKK
ncbi:MAG: hypothetical protein KC505_01155 [Myxococcales bacterium]|nr:hypothetical protein [Myxococcales bacterium]USN50844.1 MAG: hypothetical protein H6731_00020 [Myxococcales bacterium]